MDELLIPAEPKAGKDTPETVFYIGTVTGWDITTGAVIKLDGQNSSMTKPFKVLQTSRPLYTNHRYLIMKQSGTYVVLGEIGMPTYWRRITNLTSVTTTASTSEIISKVNETVTKVNTVLACLREQGILYPPES